MEAARRGTLVHRLFERLPELPPAERENAALRWLERQAGDIPLMMHREMVRSVLEVLETPEWENIFSPAALAEVPLAAVVGGQVIAGTADRLLVDAREVLIVDFKTTARPPSNLGEIPVASLRQMAAYVAALERIYPGREIRAALLYSHAPRLIALPPEVIAAHKAALSPAQ